VFFYWDVVDLEEDRGGGVCPCCVGDYPLRV
jgi:hypothetical protein